MGRSSYMCSTGIASLGDDASLSLARKNVHCSQHKIFQRDVGGAAYWNTNMTCA
jgi:hypothetical protein